MRRIPEIFVWTQHVINDTYADNFKSGLRDDFDYLRPDPGPPRPSWSTWLALPGV
jgi:hypothetical protein